MAKSSENSRGGPRLGRRAFLSGAAAVLAGTGMGACAVAPRGRFRDDPFTLGIASGEPWPDGVVLWTRLCPEPASLDGTGGMPPRPVPVRWQLARDRGMGRLVAEGAVEALPQDAHSVHVEVSGLEPAHTYYYRFIAGGAASPVGRTRTAHTAGADVARLRFVAAACQHYEHGLYTAYRHLAGEDLDFVVHLGDYIYEGARGRGGPRRRDRRHPDFTCRTLAQYRHRYALYKTDPDLKAAHAAFPFLCILDDHEVANDWAADRGPGGAAGEAFLARRAAAFKAYYEHLPLRAAQRPSGPWMRLYRKADFGRLLSLNLADTRTYRTPQPCGGKNAPVCPGAFDPAAQMLGPHQEAWLRAGFARPQARWNAIAQQVPMAEIDRDADPAVERYAMDKWDGYRVPRRRLLEFLAEAKVPNPVILSGDMHHHAAAELRPDFRDTATSPVAGEFITTSISSGGDGLDETRRTLAWMAQNPHLKFVSSLRGYTRFAVTSEAWRTDFRVVDRVTVPGGAVRTRASTVIESDRPGIVMS